jgi:hypothetical protein
MTRGISRTAEIALRGTAAGVDAVMTFGEQGHLS